MEHLDLNQLLKKSALYDQRITELFKLEPKGTARRFKAARALASLSFEHSRSIKNLVTAGLCSSGAALVRVQYESLVRALWSLYVATDDEIELSLADLTPESAQNASKSVSINKMLDGIEKHAPQVPIEPLRQFKETSWQPLNSFVHAGIHAVSKQGTGFPVETAMMMVRLSNAMLELTGIFVLIMAGVPPEESGMEELQSQFADCLPLPTSM
ncbi:DUF6988 family protein [Pseudomonas juntendi]|uniref:DUF6988 family protein n=1 Tax=Pseudomonas juntendi TaxID=2666183 RepID=UPI0018D9A4B1|nr:hypothetical protein [Pseudomonas juntendi]MBH3372421.1 hypothetical protein [Pseudomonas juntendi]